MNASMYLASTHPPPLPAYSPGGLFRLPENDTVVQAARQLSSLASRRGQSRHSPLSPDRGGMTGFQMGPRPTSSEWGHTHCGCWDGTYTTTRGGGGESGNGQTHTTCRGDKRNAQAFTCTYVWHTCVVYSLSSVHTLHYTNVWNIWNTKDGLPCKTTFRGVRTVNMTLTYVSI